MKFTRLRLSGFKSFVEPAELLIEPGLNAIVGPNGCGKSNLFDALRWVMGEARPTSIRGTEMDDMIFAGSAVRPARNTAEVILQIDNSDRTATAPNNEYDAIEISRRIEREAGSVYRINGRDVRQRDVQIFFADASSGATSMAFVRQGQIGLLISQKPLARRSILEEAAGIAGLHQRRHEAELRLRAAEANMARVDDVIRELEEQLQNLKRQARSAARYRNISGLIRKAEALAHHLRWTAAHAQRAAAQLASEKSGAAVAQMTAQAAETATAQTNAAADLPPLRGAEAEKGAVLGRLTVERDALAREEARARETAQRLRQHIAQSEQDMVRERTLEADAEGALAKLAREADSLSTVSLRAAEEIAVAEPRLIELGDALARAENRLEELTAESAQWNAKTQSQKRTRDVAAALAETSAWQLVQAEERLATAQADTAEAPDLAAAEAAVAAAQIDVERARDAWQSARQSQARADAREADARAPLEVAQRECQRLAAEAKALSDLLRPGVTEQWPPVVDSVRVVEGFEAAFAAALGDDLEAPVVEAAPNRWRDLGPLDHLLPLPDGAEPLARFVDAPPALTRRLAMTGVVLQDTGAALQTALKPGQRLVSERGDLWRWDGYSASADTPSPAALRLAQRNRLAALETENSDAEDVRAAAYQRFSESKASSALAREATRSAESREREAESAFAAAQAMAAQAARAAAERSAHLASFESEIRRLAAAREAARAAVDDAELSLRELGDGSAISTSLDAARTTAVDSRTHCAEARAALDGLKREREIRGTRLAAIAEERARWQRRREAASEHLMELGRRLDELHIELVALDAVPTTIASQKHALLDAIGIAEAARSRAADARAEAECKLVEADKAAKAADAALGCAREERARDDALAESAAVVVADLRRRIRDEIDADPEELSQRAELRAEGELPTLDHAERRVEKLKLEREQLGGVNLRAEEEAAEQSARLAALVSDRADLEGAISRLRRGIQNLNREGRERLVASFEKVNANFQQLFRKLFEGGDAKLSFTESDDPLEAGLEIYARPPGKRLQSLSLLSGGEQALAALALIFAVFLVNPAPVCVLDEVDAPLDDANVERFCNLLDEMTRRTDTRFLVITHHALTMSRMHRLYGVTMAERGVSQLVSVSLALAERIAAE